MAARLAAAGSGIKRRPVRIARLILSRGFGDLPARAGARIDEAERVEPFQRRGVIGEMLGLSAHGSLPIEPEPGEVFIYRRFIFRPRAEDIDVLDTQEEASVVLAREREIQKRRIGVPEMQKSVRGRREAEDAPP